MKNLYAVIIGLLLAVLQIGYFFHLEIRLTSAYPSFLMVMVAWLMGSAFGLWIGYRRQQSSSVFKRMVTWLFFSLVAYYISYILLLLYPYQMSWLPVHGLAVFISGAHAGLFFYLGRPLFPSASKLFFMENNGFVIGWVLGFTGYVYFSESFTLIAPTAIAILSTVILFTIMSNSDSIVPRNKFH